MSSGNREDYLISILRLTEGETAAKTTELATFMGVSPASVSGMLRELSKEGYVDYTKYKGVSLTEEGLRYARQIRKRHHVMERFLTDILDVDHQTAHEEACRIEHALSDDSAIKMCHMLGTPVDGDCASCSDPCNASRGKIENNVQLSCMRPGDSGRISHLRSDDSCIIKKLISMGFVPGRQVSLDSKVSEKGPRIIEIGNSLVALDRDMASMVFVDISD
ncbi:MAG: metal-dependent transcriptional regulator [Candidatus Methanomethylophilaceae archaeon]|jgi:DtxR family Mn-dependent transcriptional regulator|nr:metal-dependent transcriptional regulator [Candidatus Methanomethylophilaceae archaeon]